MSLMPEIILNGQLVYIVALGNFVNLYVVLGAVNDSSALSQSTPQTAVVRKFVIFIYYLPVIV